MDWAVALGLPVLDPAKMLRDELVRRGLAFTEDDIQRAVRATFCEHNEAADQWQAAVNLICDNWNMSVDDILRGAG